MHISADTNRRIYFENGSGTYLIFKRFFGNPGSSSNIYVSTPISSVIWEPTRIYVKNDYERNFIKYIQIIDNMFFGMHYKYVSFPFVSDGIASRTPTETLNP